MTTTPADLLSAASRVLGPSWLDERRELADDLLCAIYLLAEHVKSTVHPDDDEPVTVEWLRSDCGFYGDDLITHKWITTNFRLYFVDKIARGVVMYTGGDTHYKTRGQVRILLKALNVEVK